MNKIISQNLLPNLMYGKEDQRLVGTTIKVLQELMTPVECLMPVQTMSQSGEGQRIVLELEKAISSAKALFLDTRVTKALVDYIDSILQQPKTMGMHDCEMINHCLILIRNLFHVQPVSSSLGEEKTASEDSFLKQESSSASLHAQSSTTSETSPNPPSVQNSFTAQPTTPKVLTEDQIMWNLFAQRFDSILIKLLTCQQQHLWNITMVQLVSLMYREQQQGTIRKLINEWLELSLCESSTDDENNTLSSSSYDAVPTSDPVSDSSERLSPVEGGRCPKTKPSIDTNSASDKNSSLSLRCPNTSSSRDSGLGRSSTNNEGETSVDESMQDWLMTQTEKTIKKEMWKQEDDEEEEGYGSSQQKKTEEKSNKKSSTVVTSPRIEKRKVELPDDMMGTPLKDSLRDIYSTFDGGGNEKVALEDLMDHSPAETIRFRSENQLEKPLEPQPLNEECRESPISHPPHHTLTTDPSVARAKKPPDENESYSGDSSEKPPPHPLPKLVKGKVLMTGQKRTRHCMSQKMMSETQEMQELSNSTGSDCDEGPHAKRPLHQKPHKMLVKPRPSKLIQKALQERNMKRTKILKRKESSGIKAKALLHHQPTAEDISNLLKEFTLDFMLNGYSTLVQGLRMQVLLPYQMDLDKSHLLWLITYFLRFAVELDLELSQICPVLSAEVVSYLVYEGIVMQEELEIAIRNGESNLISHVRRLHLVVTALREFFISFEVCLKKDPTQIDCRQLTTIKEDLSQLVELRQIFVFLIRMYRPGVPTLSYLQDLITTNHRFLIIQEQSPHSTSSFDMVSHIKQFATMDIMLQYGRVLENFNENDEMVNECIFTMMHHVSGELRSVSVLLQPSILKVFLRIWKEGFELCVDWADLIEYVLRKCTEKKSETQMGLDRITLGQPQEIQLTAEDLDQLYTLYSTFSEQDLLEKIKDVCCDDSIEEPIKKEVIQKLLARGYISSTECTKLCAEIPQTEPVSKDLKLVSNKRRFNDSESMDTSLPLSSDFMSVCHSVSQVENALRNHEFSEHDYHDAKRFCLNQEDRVKIEKKSIPYEDLDYNMEVSSLKNFGTSTEATYNTDYDMREDSKEVGWEEGSIVNHLIDQLRENGFGCYLLWIQSEVLEACYARLKLINPSLPLPEPLFFHFAISNQPIPIIPWTTDQENAISYPLFRQLLEVLGFYLQPDSGKLYPRIPNFWSPDMLYEVAQKLGTIEQGTLKFSLKLMTEMLQHLSSVTLASMGCHKSFEERWNEMGDVNSSIDCDDSPERVSDCSMQNNRSTSTSPVSSLEAEFPPLRDSRLLCSLDKHTAFFNLQLTGDSAYSEEERDSGKAEKVVVLPTFIDRQLAVKSTQPLDLKPS
uniref:Timeless n=1 Tax=Eurydice pulchra TaxID=155694 RepID=T2C7W0_EURPU|nr:timeless [Eurydice pulchra]